MVGALFGLLRQMGGREALEAYVREQIPMGRWASAEEIAELEASIGAEMFASTYANVFDGNPTWNAIPVAGGDLYGFREESTYIQEPPFFVDLTPEVEPVQDIRDARVLALLGDSIVRGGQPLPHGGRVLDVTSDGLQVGR